MSNVGGIYYAPVTRSTKCHHSSMTSRLQPTESNKRTRPEPAETPATSKTLKNLHKHRHIRVANIPPSRYAANPLTAPPCAALRPLIQEPARHRILRSNGNATKNVLQLRIHKPMVKHASNIFMSQQVRQSSNQSNVPPTAERMPHVSNNPRIRPNPTPHHLSISKYRHTATVRRMTNGYRDTIPRVIWPHAGGNVLSFYKFEQAKYYEVLLYLRRSAQDAKAFITSVGVKSVIRIQPGNYRSLS